MKLIGNYSEDIKDLIQGEVEYNIPNDLFILDSESSPTTPPPGWSPNNNLAGALSSQEQWVWTGVVWVINPNVSAQSIPNPKYMVKLSVFQNGSFQEEYILEINKDYYVKNNQIYLRPNEILDSESYFEGNYTLQFDFIQRYEDSRPGNCIFRRNI